MPGLRVDGVQLVPFQARTLLHKKIESTNHWLHRLPKRDLLLLFFDKRS